MSRTVSYQRIRRVLDQPTARGVDLLRRAGECPATLPAPEDLDDLRIALGQCGRLACALSATVAAEHAVSLWQRYAVIRSPDLDELPARALTELRRVCAGHSTMARAEWLAVEVRHASRRGLADAPQPNPSNGDATVLRSMQQHVLAALLNAFGVLGDDPRDAAMWAVLETARAANQAEGTPEANWLAAWWERAQRCLAFRDVRNADLSLYRT